MSASHRLLFVIGENFNTTRRLKPTSPRVFKEGTHVGIVYFGPDGSRRLLDVSGIFPKDPKELRRYQVPHVAHAVRTKCVDYIEWIVRSQLNAGANIVDLCIDEISIDPVERHEWMKWLVPVVQGITDATLAIDSSDPDTILAGLTVYDRTRSQPAINSVNLEEGRQVLIDVAKDFNAYLFANASGRDGMPGDATERVENIDTIMTMMDAAGIPMTHRFVDPLAFPVGAGREFGNHYLDAVREVRRRFPDVHIFGGHSNTSFGLPRRKVVNNAFVILSILAGCDAVMIDPVMNPAAEFLDFSLAVDVLLGIDEFAMRYIEQSRAAGTKA